MQEPGAELHPMRGAFISGWCSDGQPRASVPGWREGASGASPDAWWCVAVGVVAHYLVPKVFEVHAVHSGGHQQNRALRWPDRRGARHSDLGRNSAIRSQALSHSRTLPGEASRASMNAVT